MGWQVVGRAPVQVRPASVPGLLRMRGARRPAELWSSAGGGDPATNVLSDEGAVESLLMARETRGLRTDHDVASLRWRYAGCESVGYRAVAHERGAEHGIALFRVRQRGSARECTLGDVIARAGDGSARATLARRALRASGADYAIAGSGAGASRLRGFVRSERLGPVLVWRAVTLEAQPQRWSLEMGDIESF
jgi:hypothetical protein